MHSSLSSSHKRGLKRTAAKKPPVNRKKRAFLRFIIAGSTSLAIGSLVKVYVWDDPTRQWLLTDLFPNGEAAEPLTLAPPLSKLLDDASHLNHSQVAELRSPKTVAEVIKAIRDAHASGRKISLSGVRHSMGGQALGQNTLHLDMTHLNAVHYNETHQTVTVGPGATCSLA